MSAGFEERRTIYVALLDEATPVWRPVRAIELAPGRFRLPSDQPYAREDERWEFEPGSVVECEWRALSDGPCLVAFRRAPDGGARAT